MKFLGQSHGRVPFHPIEVAGGPAWSLCWRDHEDTLARNRDKDVFVLCICSNGMAPKGNGGKKSLGESTHDRQF